VAASYGLKLCQRSVRDFRNLYSALSTTGTACWVEQQTGEPLFKGEQNLPQS
jgi:hypothetical protein